MPEPLATATSPSPGGRLPWLDGMRGAAALAVVVFHVYVISFHYYPPGSALMTSAAVRAFMSLARWGSLGVPVFFVLSGFCVGQTWLRSRSASQFFLRRWWRIFPAYYASLALVLGCALAVKLFTGANDITTLPAPTAGHLLATLALLTSPATSVPGLTWVYWTLTYEVVFYAILTPLLVLPERPRLIVLGTLNTAICVLGAWPNLALSPGPLFFAGLWPLFGLGLAVVLAPRDRRVAAIVGLVSLLAALRLIPGGSHPGVAPAALVTAALVAACAAGCRLPRWRLLEKIGGFSYSLYLIHVPVLLALGKYLVLRPEQTAARFFIGLTAAVALILACALVFYRCFERPHLQSRGVEPAPAAA
jgi:exopolysaccharide production protein ExoZ